MEKYKLQLAELVFKYLVLKYPSLLVPYLRAAVKTTAIGSAAKLLEDLLK